MCCYRLAIGDYGNTPGAAVCGRAKWSIGGLLWAVLWASSGAESCCECSYEWIVFGLLVFAIFLVVGNVGWIGNVLFVLGMRFVLKMEMCWKMELTLEFYSC